MSRGRNVVVRRERVEVLETLPTHQHDALYYRKEEVNAIVTLGDSTKAGLKAEYSVPALEWTFQHNTNSQVVNAQVFDTTGEKITPNRLLLIDTDTVRVEFVVPQAGYLIIRF